LNGKKGGFVMNMGSLKDMAGMMKMAQEAKKLQAKSEKNVQEQIDLLKRINRTLDEILVELRKRK
jgi:hypothetical protein